MSNATLFFAAIGVLGMAAQWLAWRFRLPAVILLLIAGLVFGPLTGLLAPSHVLGSLIRPLVAAAVAIILFEGGLTLDFAALRDATQAVRRIVLIAAPLMWAAVSVAAHWLAGLSWPVAAVIGGILTVTGPTVVQPILRHARMAPRPASVLRWEAIVNDPVGALFAVLAFEVFVQLRTGSSSLEIGSALGGYVLIAGGAGYLLARAISYAYRTTWVPEYLKVPILFVAVLACFVGGNLLLDEAGLLAVTVMGVKLGNSRIASLTEIRRFKEHAAVLLVSGVFVVLTADTKLIVLRMLNWQHGLFVLAILFVIRPLVIFASTIGTNLTWRERLLIGLLAPRGVVAVATAAVFGVSLTAAGVSDAPILASLVFSTVVVSVLLCGFLAVPFARWLGLASSEPGGVLLVGANPWTMALAETLRDMELPAMVADKTWGRLKPARDAAIPVYYGEILAEAAEHRLEHARYSDLIAATDSNSYNTLVCTDLAPIFGRQHVFQIGRMASQELDPNDIAMTLGGRTLTRDGLGFEELNDRVAQGWHFRKTKLSEEFDFDKYRETLAEGAQLLFALKARGELSFATVNSGPLPAAGDTVIAFSPPIDPRPETVG
jgi:NhaP-type Na+/H+ or K+/H+ antiporter